MREAQIERHARERVCVCVSARDRERRIETGFQNKEEDRDIEID